MHSNCNISYFCTKDLDALDTNKQCLIEHTVDDLASVFHQTLLNWQEKCWISDLSLYLQVRVVLILHQGNFFWYQMRTMAETTMNQNAEVWSSVSVDTCTIQLTHLSSIENSGKGGRRILGAKRRGRLL